MREKRQRSRKILDVTPKNFFNNICQKQKSKASEFQTCRLTGQYQQADQEGEPKGSLAAPLQLGQHLLQDFDRFGAHLFGKVDQHP